MWELRNLDTGDTELVAEYTQDWAYRFVATNLQGDQFWYEDGESHRDDGPADIYADGSKYWYNRGYCTKLSHPDYRLKLDS